MSELTLLASAGTNTAHRRGLGLIAGVEIYPPDPQGDPYRRLSLSWNCAAVPAAI